MRKTTVSQAQMDSLEYHTEQAHRALKRAIKRKDNLALMLAGGSYRVFYESLYQIDPHWKKQNRRSLSSKLLDRYTLQGSLSYGFLSNDVQYTLSQPALSPTERNLILGNVKRIIDHRGKNSYDNLANAAMELASERRFDILLDAISYVRLHYPKPRL